MQMRTGLSIGALMTTALLATSFAFALSSWAQAPSAEEARAIAKEAYIYGFPLVDSYRVGYAYSVDSDSPELKALWNEIRNMPRGVAPEGSTVQPSSSATPYSMLGLDLRAEPVVITVPPIGKNRDVSLQLVDPYAFDFDYYSSRTTGDEGGVFLIAGPNWKGETPKGVNRVFRSETDLALATFHTQLFNPGGIDSTKQNEAGYKIEPLSAFLGGPAPRPAPEITFVEPLSPADEKTSLEFFNVLNFVLQFCPARPSEEKLMTRFATIGVVPGKTFDVAKLSPEMKQAIAGGMADAWKALEEIQKTSVRTGQVTSGDMSGTRGSLKNRYLYRFAAAAGGIYGNSEQETMYPAYTTDASGQPLDGSTNRYRLHFAPGQLPPVNAFWSLTMYGLPASLLVSNPIDRYLIDSPMLPDLDLDADGGLTIYIQKNSPDKDRETNWLPAPDGPFMSVLRLYWPKEEALNGQWEAPAVERIE